MNSVLVVSFDSARFSLFNSFIAFESGSLWVDCCRRLCLRVGF